MNSKRKHKILSHFPNVAYNVVVIGASAGGLKPIKQILSALPADFPAAIVIVQHISSQYPSHLKEIVNRHTALQVKQAKLGDVLRPGTIYTYVPGKHLKINPNGTLSLSDEAKVNYARPAIDKLFTSTATSYGLRAIAVVLSGLGRDGALGVTALKKSGATVIAQDKDSCQFSSMPQAAIKTGKVDFVLPPEAIAPTLVSLIMTEQVA